VRILPSMGMERGMHRERLSLIMEAGTSEKNAMLGIAAIGVSAAMVAVVFGFLWRRSQLP
jgi:hypothetical protein